MESQTKCIELYPDTISLRTMHWRTLGLVEDVGRASALPTELPAPSGQLTAVNSGV